MTRLFDDTDLEALSAPHVGRAFFVMLDLPDGITRLHNGVGRANIGGYEWRGVTDPIGGRLASLSEIEEPQFGSSPAIQIILTGVDVAFMRSVKSLARQIEGRPAEVYFAVIDPETMEVLIDLRRIFMGSMSAPSLSWSGVNSRMVGLTIESIWSGMKFPSGGKWSSADQKRRYPDDLGLDFLGVEVEDNWRT